jgi:hypothetical protein
VYTPLVVVTVIVAGCDAVMLDRLAGIVTLHWIVVVFVGGRTQELLISGQLGLLIDICELESKPVPVMMTGEIVVPAAQDVGETPVMVTGFRSVSVVAAEIDGVDPMMVAVMLTGVVAPVEPAGNPFGAVYVAVVFPVEQIPILEPLEQLPGGEAVQVTDAFGGPLVISA